MPLDPVARRYAHALYVDKLEELTRKHAARTAELCAGLAQRGMFPHTAGHYHSEMTRIGVEHIGEIANARVDSFLAAYARAKLPIDDQAVVDIVREATQFCEAQAKNLAANTQEQVGRAGMPPGVGDQLAEIIAQQISAIQARIRRKLSAKRDEEIMAARAVPQEVPPPTDKLTSGLKEKPIDRWLGIGAVVIGVVLFLVPKTPTLVVVLLVLSFLLLLHPVWNFWWIEKSLFRRIVAFLIVCLLLLYLGKIAWPSHVPVPADGTSSTAIVGPMPKPKPPNPVIAVSPKANPRPTSSQERSTLVIPPNTKIEATASAPNSMAAGINTGTMIQGDLPPQFRLTTISENMPQNGSYETQFELEVTTGRAIVLHLKAIASKLVGDLKIDNKRPAGEGGLAFQSTGHSGVGYIEQDYKDIESGTYIITLRTSQPDKIQLQYH